MSTNKFAEKQLKKHGWKEGSGLGKEEAGIKEAIKVKIKNDTAGIGHNQGDEFTFHWWDHVFNKAAGSISVEDSEEGVALKKSANNGPISNKKTKSYDNKAMLYGKFVKAATLSNGNYESQTKKEVESDSEDEKEKIRNRLVSDKALEMCEGMTAHKGARHGLKLSGKLVRVQEQEKALLESMKKALKKKNSGTKEAKEEIKQENEESYTRDNDSKNKQKKKKRKRNEDDEMKHESCDESKNNKMDTFDKELSNDSGVDSEMINKKKKKKKRSKNVEKNHEKNEDQTMGDIDVEIPSKKKNKTLKRNNEENHETEEQHTHTGNSETLGKKKKKNKNVDENHEQTDKNEKQPEVDIHVDSELLSEKKKKKRKLEEKEVVNDSDSGKSKKKKRQNIESNEEVIKMSDSDIKYDTVTKKSKKKTNTVVTCTKIN